MTYDHKKAYAVFLSRTSFSRFQKKTIVANFNLRRKGGRGIEFLISVKIMIQTALLLPSSVV